MEKFTCIIIQENENSNATLVALLNQTQHAETIGNAKNIKDGVALVNELQPQLLFLSLRGDDLSVFKALEKIKKQPTIIFIVAKSATIISTLKTNGLNYLTEPLNLIDLETMLTKLSQMHNQLAQKMQSLLGKLKFED